MLLTLKKIRPKTASEDEREDVLLVLFIIRFAVHGLLIKISKPCTTKRIILKVISGNYFLR